MTEANFEAPGSGTWTLDSTHFSKPVTAFNASANIDGSMRGFKEGSERYGLMFSHSRSAVIGGFFYSKMIFAFVPEDAPPGPPPDGFFEQPGLVARMEKGKNAIRDKLWRQDLKRWDDEIKPDSIQRNQTLQSVAVETLDTESLAAHIKDCHSNLAEMWYRHHIFTFPSVLPTGLYLDKVCQWAGISSGEALQLLKGSSPVSLGIALGELKQIAQLLKQAGISADQFSGKDAAGVLQELMSLSDDLALAIQKYLDLVGYQLTSGYDILERYLLEMPEILLANIFSAATTSDSNLSAEGDSLARAAVRDKVPAQHQSEFDALLDEARLINRLRDERGVYNEAKAYGLARRAILEAGRRLQQQKRLSEASLFLHASLDQMLSVLAGDTEPDEAELQQREDWYQSKSTDDVPPFIGEPPAPPPPLEALPEICREGEGALRAAMGNVFDALDSQTPGSEEEIRGTAVSPGIYEGAARVIRNPDDFHRLQQGDVMIAKNTSSAFNAVIPIVSAIVTDRGGQLSHAAIVAREYGIPCIVSTRDATRKIPDGATVRVDGAAGTVEVLS